MAAGPKHYLVYIVECSDGSHYTGITNNLTRRLRQHNGEIKGGAKYTSKRMPVKLIMTSCYMNKSEVLKLEYKTKKQRKAKRIDFLTRTSFEVIAKKFSDLPPDELQEMIEQMNLEWLQEYCLSSYIITSRTKLGKENPLTKILEGRIQENREDFYNSKSGSALFSKDYEVIDENKACEDFIERANKATCPGFVSYTSNRRKDNDLQYSHNGYVLTMFTHTKEGEESQLKSIIESYNKQKVAILSKKKVDKFMKEMKEEFGVNKDTVITLVKYSDRIHDKGAQCVKDYLSNGRLKIHDARIVE